ncbi:MAG: DUF1987 domain-containing protein [Cyclobacteriaceae bacterium]
MDELRLASTRITPEVKFQPREGTLVISGRSHPENAPGFFDQVIEAIDNFSSYTTPRLTTNFQLEYFNTSTSRCLLDVLYSLKKVGTNDKEIEINWYYDEDDEDMMEMGEDFAVLTDLNINLHPIAY